MNNTEYNKTLKDIVSKFLFLLNVYKYELEIKKVCRTIKDLDKALTTFGTPQYHFSEEYLRKAKEKSERFEKFLLEKLSEYGDIESYSVDELKNIADEISQKYQSEIDDILN